MKKTTKKTSKKKKQSQQTPKIPKTFLIYVESQNQFSGYVRFRSYVSDNTFKYNLTITKKISEASRYVGIDNTKNEAKKIKEIYGFNSVCIIDEHTKRLYFRH